LTYGFDSSCDYRIRTVEGNLEARRVTWQSPFGCSTITVPWLPRTTLLSAMGALAAAESVLGAPIPSESVEGILVSSDWRQSGRFSLLPLLDGTLVVDGSYNSNPASLRAALEGTRELAEARGSAFHLVLGEMRELGNLSRSEHQNIGRELASFGAASITAIAGDARFFIAPDAETEAVPAGFFSDVVAAAPHVLRTLRPGDVVLVKGSRGVESDRIVMALSSSRGAEALR
jgi:UDP-N-acetylmuramoyl-tripeptide--D-alanyl-D-alanine ligase